MQRECFPNEISLLEKGEKIRKKEFLQLKLYLDEHGTIRIHGRLRDEHFTKTNQPILFGYKHPLTILFILDKHQD